MSRLPTVGGDDGSWGPVMNDFLQVFHNSDGTPKPGMTGRIVVPPTGDTTGDDDVAAINAAYALFNGATSLPPGPFNQNLYWGVQLTAGTYYINATITVPWISSLVGVGQATIIRPTASFTGSSAIYWHGWPNGTGAQFGALANATSGKLADFRLDGEVAVSPITQGLDIGDGWGGKVLDVAVVNFDAAGQKGIHLINRSAWTEKWRVRADVLNCATAVDIDMANGPTGGLSSHEYSDYEFYVFCNAGQNGVNIHGGAWMAGGRLCIRGNFGTSDTAQVGGVTVADCAVLTVTGSGTDKDSNSKTSTFGQNVTQIQVESNQGKAYKPMTVKFGSAANTFHNNTGIMAFQFNDADWTDSNFAAGNGSFGGPVTGDSAFATALGTPTGWK